MSKKKPLKSLITFSSQEIYDRATAEENTSAVVEALLARHYGLDITGNTVQAQLRRAALGTMLSPAIPTLHRTPANVVPGVTPVPTATGLKIPVFPLGSTPANAPALALSPAADELADEDGDLDGQHQAPLELPPAAPTTAETGVAKASSTAAEVSLPDRPATTAAPAHIGGAFAPATTTAPAPNLHAPGARLCPTCAQDMGTDPVCLNCI